MRLLGWMLLFGVVGCGGDGGSDSGTNTSVTGDDDDVVTPGDPCADVNTYDPTQMGCEALGTAWEELMASAKNCTVDADCAVVKPACENWDSVSCWYAYNHSCIESSTINAFNSQAQTLNCITSTGQVGVCKCGGAPDTRCVQGTCCAVGVDFICEQ